MFDRMSIRKKLALVLWGTALLAFAVAGTGLLLYQNLTLEARVRQIMEPYAQLVSVSTESAVAFEDPVRAQEILNSLRINPEIVTAQIILDDGRILAGFGNDPKAGTRLAAMTDAIRVDDGKAELMQSLPQGGHLHLTMNLGQLREQARQTLLLFGAGVLVLVAATFGFFMVLRRTIINPVAALVEATELVRTRNYYNLRVPASGNDEIGRLGQSFNAMLEAVRERERELRQLTAFQRTILDNAAYGIISTTPDGVVTSFNPAAERLLGYSADDVVGMKTPSLWHDPGEVAQRAQRLSEELGVAVEPGFEAFVARARRNLPDENEWSFIRKDGRRVPVLLSVTALRAEDGQITGFLGMVSDLTERKRTEEELHRYRDHLEEEVQQRTADLIQARNAAEAANLAKSAFLANMSHELRTPLNAILGFSNIMRKDPLLPESQQQNLHIVNRSGEHLLTLINDVLEMAKIESGRTQLENAPFDLGVMVRDVTDMMQMRAKEKSLTLQVDQSSHFPRYIVGDEARLRQVIINLIGNAIKFTEQGGVILRLGARQNSISHLMIEVEDSGAGIAPQDQQRIFEPFVQLGEQGVNKGTGLGLTITRQFVQMMGGTIALESTPGKGTLFRIDLPLNEATEADIVKPRETTRGEVAWLAAGQPAWRVLVVEDQRDNQLLLAKLMESVGFQVKIAENGALGVQMFQEWHPHFIWMDRRMPVMDGMEATRRIRALPGGKEVKIVAVTASAFSEQRTEMLNAGMDDFVRKPFHPSEIYDCLAKHLGAKYRYEGEPAAQELAVALTPETLAVLPETLRAELENALRSLKSERIALAIQQVAAYDERLQSALKRLADNFDYPSILQVLRNR
jgi:signal transduction histidine kinase/CheY-like chemotaxis protein/HAMP domain-containing protein